MLFPRFPQRLLDIPLLPEPGRELPGCRPRRPLPECVCRSPWLAVLPWIASCENHLRSRRPDNVRHGEFDDEHRPPPGVAFHPDIAFLPLDDSIRDRKTQPRSLPPP